MRVYNASVLSKYFLPHPKFPLPLPLPLLRTPSPLGICPIGSHRWNYSTMRMSSPSSCTASWVSTRMDAYLFLFASLINWPDMNGSSRSDLTGTSSLGKSDSAGQWCVYVMTSPRVGSHAMHKIFYFAGRYLLLFAMIGMYVRLVHSCQTRC